MADSSVGASAAGLRRRAGTSSSGPRTRGSAPAGSQGGTSTGGFSVRLYNDDAPGFKVGPYFIVLASLVYIGIVILLHIWSRIGGKIKAE